MTDGSGRHAADFDLSGRVGIVTGSSRGIGLAIARRLREAGASVMHNDRSTPDGMQDRHDLHHLPNPDFQAADVSTEEGAQQLVDATLRKWGRLDILVNNAGVQPAGSWSDTPGTDWDAVMAANARSVHMVIRAAVPALARAGGAASIVNIASIRGQRPGSGMLYYSASKAAVLSMTRTLAAELGPMGIRVNAISPGLVARPGLEQSWPEGVARFAREAPLGRIGQPMDVANACVFLLAPASSWITGINLVVDGGVSLVR